MFIDQEVHGVRVRFFHNSIAALSSDDLKARIHELNVDSHTIGCASFPGSDPSNTSTLVVFAGNLERYSMLSVTRDVDCRVIYFQDSESWWYGGSDLLPDIKSIARFIETERNSGRILFFGQSSGAYASLVCGGLLADTDVIACSPQTFVDRSIKARLFTSPSLAVHTTPDYLLDVRDLYGQAQRNGFAAVLFAACELNNPYGSHFWLDHLHILRLVDIDSISLFMTNVSNHSLVLRRAPAFSILIANLVKTSNATSNERLLTVQQFASQISDLA